MRKNSYLPDDDSGKVKWLANFAGKLDNYKTTLNLDDNTIKQVKEDSGNFTYIISIQQPFIDFNKNLTSFKNILRSGSKDNSPIGAIPTPPATPVLPNTAVADIFGRSAKLVQTIKGNANYNEAIGKDLGIIGEEKEVDINKMKPSLDCVLKAGKPDIKWKKDGMQGIHLYVDRSNGSGFTMLATSTAIHYLDAFPLPPAGQSAVWKYKAIYILKDNEVGIMSDVLSVSVSAIV